MLSFYRSVGFNFVFAIALSIFLISLIIFAMKKPTVPGEEQDPKVTKTLVAVGSIVCLTFLIFIGGFTVRIIDFNNENVTYLSLLIIEILLNLPIPIAYIISIPNLKKYVVNSIIDSFDYIISNIAFLFVDVVNFFYDLISALKPSPRIYPTIE